MRARHNQIGLPLAGRANNHVTLAPLCRFDQQDFSLLAACFDSLII